MALGLADKRVDPEYLIALFYSIFIPSTRKIVCRNMGLLELWL
jgi:hypothetical protein